jgi:hypothetical protein
MSIATLKKKTQVQYNNMSVGSPNGFSLNGGYRNQGFVGQTSLSRSLPRTLMKGNTMRGHGGCCGFYPMTPVVQSAVISTENNSVIKPSVLGTDGMLDTKYRWINRPFPYATVKPDTTSNLNTQGDFIFTLKRNIINKTALCDISKNITKQICSKTCNESKTKSFSQLSTNAPTIYKPESTYLAISQGEYIANKQNCLEPNDTNFTLLMNSKSVKKIPFGC